MKIIASVPVWGPRYVRMFRHVMLPAFITSLRYHHLPVHLVLHTDATSVAHLMTDADQQAFASVELRPVPRKPTYVALQEGHADAVRQAAVGDIVILLNADIVVSENFVTRCVHEILLGAEAIVLLGIRTMFNPKDLPPPGMGSRDLLVWAWQHRHTIIKDLEWPHGKSLLPTNLFWEADNDVVARGFHLHPAAILKNADTAFKSTIDGDLLDCYSPDVIYVVTHPDDMSMLEVSPPDKRFPVRQAGALDPQRVASSMRTRASAMHCWLFTHRIVVCGTGAAVTNDDTVATRILDRMTQARGLASSPQRGRDPVGRRGQPK